MSASKFRLLSFLIIIVLFVIAPIQVMATDVITNGSFDSNVFTGWTNESTAQGDTAWDSSVYGNASGSLQGTTVINRNRNFVMIMSQSLGTVDATDSVLLSLWWYKASYVVNSTNSQAIIRIIRPAGDSVDVWTDSQIPDFGTPISGSFSELDISSHFTTTGTYTIRLVADMTTGNNKNAQAQMNYDDLVVDVRPFSAANNAPTIVSSATQVSPASVNRIGANTTTVSADFTDLDSPGIGAFNCTFKINDISEYTLVNNQPNGSGGLTIVDNGGGSYTASYNYNPDDASHATGVYDLYFEVTDGSDIAIDDYASNSNELTITQQNLPTIVSGATQVSPASVNRVGANTTTISADFTDLDIPGIGAFNCTFKINDVSEYTLVNNQANGGGGLTIIDNGGGSYTASYSYNPDDASHATGVYDLYFEVSDGSDNAIDNYAANTNELTITQQNVPTIAVSATQVSPASVNRIGSNTTTISADFTDLDQPAVGTFTCTFKINDASEYTLVNNLAHGAGGLTIINNGGGSYTASYVYNPDDAAHSTGDYDLYFEVSDGSDNAIDGYANNPNELNINELNSPTIVASATQVSPASVNRIGANTTTISTVFNDVDQPGVGAFTCTFKINDVSEYTLLNNQANGAGGLTIIDNGSGSYTASYTYNPDDAAHATGTYDLYFEVSDGTGSGNGIDSYANNPNELTITQQTAPTIVADATQASPTTVNRFANITSTISANFTDIDQPLVSSFIVTIKVKDVSETEYILVNGLTDGNGGLTITDNTGGSYTASYDWDPGAGQTLGDYDLYFNVSDGTANVTDGYLPNANELNVFETIVNYPPVIVADTTVATPSSVNRQGAFPTVISTSFTDSDIPGVGEFTVSFRVRYPNDITVLTLADKLANGVGGMSITDDGGGDYTASISWDPPNDQTLGYYDLQSTVYDSEDSAKDDFASNLSDLLISSGGESVPPAVANDATFASPSGVERIGTNTTTISATFTDVDAPAVSVFLVTFKLREPDNSTEIILANSVQHGTGGVTISDLGGGVYTASIDWDPGDAQAVGYYDLYFSVAEGGPVSIDEYSYNEDELQVYDAVSNNPPTLSAGNTFVLPVSINRIGSEFTMIKSTFTDVDFPGIGAFTITFKVRDELNTEYTLVNAAQHDQQGLRVAHTGGGVYEASVLWDPGAGQATGTYDLYFYVEDNNAAGATDDYSPNNLDELTITSSAILGDGNLLVRTNDADNCGGPNSACHNILDHQGQNCLTCHAPHNTKNIYLVRETITTPSNGDQAVLFKTTTGALGDPTSGGMADSTDGVSNGVCEVCHNNTDHHRFDMTYTTPEQAIHNDGANCAGCHTHAEGFPNLEGGGGEGSGGDGCGCHSALSSNMKGGTSSYHHNILSENGDYNVASKTCLMCHVNHDIFRPDLNTGFGQRAKNLRVDITTPVVQGSAAVLTNTDYSSSGSGGICLSCHTNVQTKSYTPPDGRTSTVVIPKSDFDASDAHNYEASATFTTDGSTFNANCIKCHNDTQTKQYQSSTNKFTTHDNPYGRLLSPFGVASPTDPMEEKVCYGCHSVASNPNSGSNMDYYNAGAMTTTSLRIEESFGLAYTHPTETYSGRHSETENASGLADGNRHAECADCHSVHAARKGTHDGSSTLVSNALIGVWGVEPTAWPAATVPTDNANVFDVPASYTKVDPAVKEYQICLKCHSNYTTLPSGIRNIAAEMNPNYPSTHGLTIASQNSFCNTSTMLEPWASSGVTYCSDCHRSDNAADPEGPHGSNQAHLLVATITSDDNLGTPLCYVCHLETVYWSSKSDGANSRYGKHPSVQGSHASAAGCFACHMWDHASTAGLGVTNQNDWPGGAFGSGSNPPDIQIWIHGQNKKWVYDETSGSAGSGNSADAFINGFIANIDYSTKQCWTETCKNHSPQSY